MSYGPTIKVHKFVLNLSEEMRLKIQYAKDGYPKRMFDRQNRWIDLPETLRFVPTVQVLFLLYLGKSVYCPGESIKDALAWFSVSRVIKVPFENNKFFEDPTCHPKGSLKLISKNRFERLVVPYAMERRAFLWTSRETPIHPDQFFQGTHHSSNCSVPSVGQFLQPLRNL
ncbi:unnamed protein product [Allacma fusca]|uniref:Uncharacterized protein n=1 Tax=Allacma fusca TaxID=39272 RepID=A0A8J2JFS7_9HEXA|nr:unnamed protein product [Allacma fusca]